MPAVKKFPRMLKLTPKAFGPKVNYKRFAKGASKKTA